MKKIQSIPREVLAQAVDLGLVRNESIRQYDVIKDLESGMNIEQVADKHGISRRHIFYLKKKYR